MVVVDGAVVDAAIVALGELRGKGLVKMSLNDVNWTGWNGVGVVVVVAVVVVGVVMVFPSPLPRTSSPTKKLVADIIWGSVDCGIPIAMVVTAWRR